MSRTPVLPPLDGSVDILPGLVDFHAQHNPDLPWAIFPSASGGVASITFSEFAKATHRIAHIVRPDRAGPDGEVVAVAVNCDTILYVALLVGMIRAGVVVSLVSSARRITES